MEMNLKNIIPKILTGDANPDEKAFFQEHIKNSPENYEEYLQLNEIWNRSEKMDIVDIPDIELEWLSISRKITENKNSIDESNGLLNILKTIWTGIVNPKLKPVYSAAIIVVIFLSTLLLWNDEEIVLEIITYSTRNAEIKLIELPDGSHAMLNCGSTISFPKDFVGNERNVELEGEAFFTVTKGVKPFIVVTDNANARVLGTEFDVWARGNETRVVVMQGIVNLSSKFKDDQGVNLIRNQASEISNDESAKTVDEVDSDLILGWRQGRLVFKQTPVSEMVQELERFYNISMNVENDKINDLTLTGTFSSSNVDSVLTMISLALRCEYQFDDGVYFLK